MLERTDELSVHYYAKRRELGRWKSCFSMLGNHDSDCTVRSFQYYNVSTGGGVEVNN